MEERIQSIVLPEDQQEVDEQRWFYLSHPYRSAQREVRIWQISLFSAHKNQLAHLLSSLTLAACFILDSLTFCLKASWSNLALAAGASGAVPDFPASSALDGPEGGTLAGVGGARGVYH